MLNFLMRYTRYLSSGLSYRFWSLLNNNPQICRHESGQQSNIQCGPYCLSVQGLFYDPKPLPQLQARQQMCRYSPQWKHWQRRCWQDIRFSGRVYEKNVSRLLRNNFCNHRWLQSLCHVDSRLYIPDQTANRSGVYWCRFSNVCRLFENQPQKLRRRSPPENSLCHGSWWGPPPGRHRNP